MLDLDLDINTWTRKLADTCGYKHELVCDRFRKPTLMKLPELIAFPPGFDFFDENIPGQHFIGCCVYEERQQPPFPWEKLDAHRPLFYCALGTVPFFNKAGYMNFFETVVRASTARPDCQWVLALGSTLGIDELGKLPENVIAVQRAPQLALLKRARMMITHGGASTVKECLYYGVPMIVIPLAEDQYGNAARVAYHGVGFRADLRKLTVKYLQDLVEAVDKSSYIRWQSIVWSRKSKDIEKSNLAVFLIEKFLSEIQGTKSSPSDTVPHATPIHSVGSQLAYTRDPGLLHPHRASISRLRAISPTKFFAETFACGRGSQDSGSEFECVEEE